MAGGVAGSQIQVRYEEFRDFSFAIRRLDKDLYNAMRRELREEVRQVREDLREAWRFEVEPELRQQWGSEEGEPIKGGAKNILSYVSSTRVRVSASKSQSMKYLNAGYVRHPGVTNPYDAEAARKHWYTTSEEHARGGWDREVETSLPEVRRRVSETVNTYATIAWARLGRPA